MKLVDFLGLLLLVLVTHFCAESFFADQLRCLFRKWFEPTINDERFIDQKVVYRYRDFKEVGEWWWMKPRADGTYEYFNEGKMLSETVKFVGRDGKVKLGSTWIPDNDRHVTGFDPSPPID
jgi:hypothetical protein